MLIPLSRHGKEPDVPKGSSWKRHPLSVEEAVVRLERGLNVGVVALGGKGSLLFVDLDDNLELADKLPSTLTVKTRNGGLQLYYINDGSISFNVAKSWGEVRAVWQYVVAPGCYVPPSKPRGDGHYKIINEIPPRWVSLEELGEALGDLTPSKQRSKGDIPIDVDFKRAEHTLVPFDLVLKVDGKLRELLSGPSPCGYKSRSEADLAAASRTAGTSSSSKRATREETRRTS